MEVTIEKLQQENLPLFCEMISLFEEVFEMKGFQLPSKAYLEKLLKKKDYIVFVALASGSVVGGLVAHVLDSCYFESSEVYLYDLAVKTSLQRKGIGSELIFALLSYCKENGYKEMFVQADLADGYAIEFYLKNGGMREEVVHFNYPVPQVD